MVTYLLSFIPQLSSHTVTLRGLLVTDLEYKWNATYQVTFDKFKLLGCQDITLRYFNTKKPEAIQVNASSKGIRAMPIQDDGPVPFTSKVLTPTEQYYANNERELLACVFSAECFQTYVFGRHFMIEGDHKSLEQISMKNLAGAPLCLQTMLLQLSFFEYFKPAPQHELHLTISLVHWHLDLHAHFHEC